MEWLYHLFGKQSPLEDAHKEIAALKSQIDQLSKVNRALIDSERTIKAERDSLRLQLDEALKKPVPPTDGAVKKPRSRTKPPTTTD